MIQLGTIWITNMKTFIPHSFGRILVLFLLIVSPEANAQPGVWDPTYTPAITN